MTPPLAAGSLPLFPLQTVLFPGGLLPLKIFEARYLDLMGACLREGRPFGVVALRQGSEVRLSDADEATMVFEEIGCTARLLDVDSPQPGILMVRCRGEQRFRLREPRMQDNGLWIAETQMLPPDPVRLVEDAQQEAARALSRLIQTLRSEGVLPFLEPFQLEEAGWVANRWGEILPIPLEERQALMALQDPQLRLQRVGRLLREQGVVY